MAQPHQKAVIALLLCAPSTLHKHWKANDTPKFDAELERLGFSNAAKRHARAAVARIATRGKRALFEEGASIMKDDVWAGGEPHPDDNDSLRLATIARQFDNE